MREVHSRREYEEESVALERMDLSVCSSCRPLGAHLWLDNFGSSCLAVWEKTYLEFVTGLAGGPGFVGDLGREFKGMWLRSRLDAARKQRNSANACLNQQIFKETEPNHD